MLEEFHGHTTNRAIATELTKNKGKQKKSLLWEWSTKQSDARNLPLSKEMARILQVLEVGNSLEPPVSGVTFALGHSRRFRNVRVMSAVPPIAAIVPRSNS